MLRLPKKMLRLIVGVYTGHNCLNRHLSVLGLVNNAKCSNCNEADETAPHYLCHCSHYGAVRTRIWGKPFLHPSEVPHIAVKDLLRFLHPHRGFQSTLVRNTRGFTGGWTMGPSAAWFYEGQLRLHQNNNNWKRRVTPSLYVTRSAISSQSLAASVGHHARLESGHGQTFLCYWRHVRQH